MRTEKQHPPTLHDRVPLDLDRLAAPREVSGHSYQKPGGVSGHSYLEVSGPGDRRFLVLLTENPGGFLVPVTSEVALLDSAQGEVANFRNQPDAPRGGALPGRVRPRTTLRVESRS